MKNLSLCLIVIFYFTFNINNSVCQWSTDTRLTFSPDTSISFYNSSKHIAANGNYIHTVWIDHRDGDYEIYYKRSANYGAEWSPDVRLTNTPGASLFNCIAVNGQSVHVLWSDNRSGGNQIYYKLSTDNGETWNSEIRVSDTAYTNSGPSIAISGLNLYAAWHTNYGSGNTEVTYKHSTDGGVTWGQETRLTYAPGFSNYPSIAVSGLFVNICWYDFRDNDYEIYYKRSTDGGISWEQDKRLTYAAGASVWESMAVHGTNIHIVWHDIRDGNFEIYYKHSTDMGVNWEEDKRITNDFNISLYPNIAVSGSLIHIVWHDLREAYYGVYYNHSTDGGDNWGADSALTTFYGNSVYPSISLSGSYIHLLWTDDRDGNLEIYYKNNPTGNVIGIVPITSEIPDQFHLYQNYPNPFNPKTKIKFALPKSSFVNLKIYDMLGREIETLIQQQLNPGIYELDWSALNLPSGIYIYTLSCGDFKGVKKMTLIK